MSDGERVIFYMIGEVVSVPENSIVVIYEPEMHINKAITKKLWNEIEVERPDCTFVCLTRHGFCSIMPKFSKNLGQKF